MLGFVDSYNVSVAAALTLYEARCGRCTAHGAAPALSDGDVQSEAEVPAAAEGPAANPGLLSAHERSVLLALMLLRQTVCPCC